MKKFLCLIISLIIILSLTGCYDSYEVEEKSTEEIAATENEVNTQLVTVFFPDDEVMYLMGEVKEIEEAGPIETAICVFNELLKEPVSEDLKKGVNGDVRLLDISIDENNICTIDLSKEFREFNTGGSAKESMAIYSIVNSLCMIEGIDKVKINIEGISDAEFGGHFYMGEPFEPDISLFKQVDEDETTEMSCIVPY